MDIAKKLQDIHSIVFKNFTYVTDKKKHGQEEYWEVIPESFTAGNKLTSDCEDFAMTCRKLCRDQAIRPTRLVVCLDETGAGHCVMECLGYVLDNRYDKLVTKNFLEGEGYKWLAISGELPGQQWTKVN